MEANSVRDRETVNLLQEGMLARMAMEKQAGKGFQKGQSLQRGAIDAVHVLRETARWDSGKFSLSTLPQSTPQRLGDTRLSSPFPSGPLLEKCKAPLMRRCPHIAAGMSSEITSV